LFYTRGLSEAEADKIKVYFNYDMIGSPFPIYRVYDGNNVATTTLLEYLTSQGIPAELG
jgi:aminopeptidase Y